MKSPTVFGSISPKMGAISVSRWGHRQDDWIIFRVESCDFSMKAIDCSSQKQTAELPLGFGGLLY
jgi:hypothetical protein